MTTEAKFKYALKEMMLSLPLEEINVTSLCDKCGCHRQTFYYHYRDIYDLLTAIFWNEQIDGFDKCKSSKDALYCFLAYAKVNFTFFRSTFNSSASDLPDDFIYGTLRKKFLEIFSNNKKENGLKIENCRTLSRRYARTLSDEFSYCFKELVNLTPEKFEKTMGKYIELCTTGLLPTMEKMVKEER